MFYFISMEFNPKEDGYGDRSASLITSDKERGEKWVEHMASNYNPQKEPIEVLWFKSTTRKGYRSLMKKERI